MSKPQNKIEDLKETFISISEREQNSEENFLENNENHHFEDEIPLQKTHRTIIPHSSHSTKNRKMRYSSYFRLISYTKKEWLLFSSGLIFIVLSQVGGIFLPYISGKILDVIINTGDSGALNEYCLIFIGVFLVSSVAFFFRYVCMSFLADRVILALRNECFEKFINYDIEFFDKRKTGELLSRLGSDISTLRMAVGANISTFCRNIILCGGCFVVMFILSWKLSLIVMFLVPIFMIFTTIFSRYSQTLSKRFQNIMADTSVIAEECFSNIRTVKSFSSEEQETSHFRIKTQEAFRTAFKRALATGVYRSLTEMVTNIGTIAVLWFGGYHILHGDMTSGELVSFLIYSNTYANSSSALSDSITSIVVASGVAETLFDLLDYKPGIINQKKNGESIDLQNFEGKIQFIDAGFSYPSKSSVKTLDGLNLQINPGETIAICGPSGGGKSTIISLIERFYDLTEGSLLINGIDIKEYDLRVLHKNIGFVSQEPVLFSGTIEENIVYGVSEYTKSEMFEAAKLANAYNFITDLSMFPDGFNTLVGERGVKLSGGQKQRVAIARALIKKPKILIFDESTSALDADSEHQVQLSIDNLIQQGNMTVIIIAHRLSTIINCKRIIVVNQGKIVEEGDHETLVKNNGFYKGLIEKQMQN